MENGKLLEGQPLNWQNETLRALRDALVAAYSKLDDARLLARQAGLPTGGFPLYSARGSMSLLWPALLNEMARRGLMGRLVEEARDDPTAAALHQTFVLALGAAQCKRRVELY